MGARTGEQFLENLRTTRSVWLGDGRIDDATAHPAGEGGPCAKCVGS
jgi:aromatic ring hydroxylase